MDQTSIIHAIIRVRECNLPYNFREKMLKKYEINLGQECSKIDKYHITNISASCKVLMNCIENKSCYNLDGSLKGMIELPLGNILFRVKITCKHV